LVPLGSLLASHLGAPGCQNRAKICPKHVLKLNFVKKADFHKTIVKPLPKSTKWPKTGRYIRLRWPQDASKTILKSVFSLLKIDFNFDSFWGRFWLPFWLPESLPFGTLLELNIDQKIDPTSDCLKGRSKIAPRPPKTLPRRPPDPPREPQDPPRRLPDPSRTPPDTLPDPPGRPKMLFRRIWPNDVFRKKQKLRTRGKHVEKKVDNGHPQWSPAMVLTKTESTFTTVGTQRVAAVVARSALQSAAPSAARRVVNPL
jgi:hypothetical protein